MKKLFFKREDVEDIVAIILKKLKTIGISPPFNHEKLKKLASFLNIEIVERHFGYYLLDDPLLSIEDKYPLDGRLKIIKIKGEEKIQIILNADRPIKRANFTIAHELGHYFLHYKLGIKNLPKDTMYTFNRKVIYDPIEREANWFAVALLMPKQMIIEDWQKLQEENLPISHKIEQLANKFHVSQLAMKYRLEELGLI